MTDNNNEVQRSLGQLEGKMDMLITEVRTSNKMHLARIITSEERLTSLETWRTRILAAGAILSGLATAAWAFIK